MYNELWDVDVNHSEEVYVFSDQAEESDDQPVEELPFHIPRD